MEIIALCSSLSIYGEMRSADQSDTIKIFENLVETASVKQYFKAEVLDSAAVVQAVVPKGSTNFRQYIFIEQISPEYPKPY